MKEYITKEKGITLVALVVTIVVLIILAGISINLLMGENGIITKAVEAGKKQKIAEIKEKLSLEIASAETDAIIRGEELEKTQLGDIISKYGELQSDEDTIITTEGKHKISLKEIWYGVLNNSGSYTDKIEQIEILEKELEELKKKYEELEQINSGNSQILEELRNKIKELENLLKQEQEKVKERETQISDLNNKLDTLKNDYDTLNKNYTKLNVEYINFKTKIAQAITNQGIDTDVSADADTMANNILNILKNGIKPLIFTSSPVDMKVLLPDIWDKLTIDDFIIGVPSFAATCDPYGEGPNFNNTFYIDKYYDSKSGVLTFSNINYYYVNTGSFYGQFRLTSYDVFAVYKGTIGGK